MRLIIASNVGILLILCAIAYQMSKIANQNIYLQQKLEHSEQKVFFLSKKVEHNNRLIRQLELDNKRLKVESRRCPCRKVSLRSLPTDIRSLPPLPPLDAESLSKLP